MAGFNAAPELLVYDGDCSFCQASARWIAARWHGPEQALAWQELGTAELAQLGLTLADVRAAAWWIDADGRRSRGHIAIARALRASSGWPALVGRILLVPPFRWLAAGAYPAVARWRHRLPGGTASCRRQGPLTQPSMPAGDAFVHTPRRT